MKLLKSAAAIAVVFSMTSCLEKLPGDYILEEEGMKSLSDAEQTLTGIYTAYMSSALYSGYLTLCPDIQADFVYAVQGNTNQFGTHWLWDIRSTNAEIESVYAALYRVIGRCNFYLDQVEELRNSLTDDEEIQYLDYYTGETYCARALAYSELLKCFCKAYDPATAENELGVVLADSYFGEKPAKRASLKESYEFVIRDLEKAEEMLDEENDGFDAPYFTNASAHAIHARVALYMQDWDAAIEHSTHLMESDAFALATARSYATDTQTFLQYLWTNDSSYENIWRIGYTAAPLAVSKLMASLQSHMASNPNSIAQAATVAALNGPQDCVAEMLVEFKKRRDYIFEREEAIPLLSALKPQGAFYLFVDVSGTYGKSYEGEMINSAADFATILLDKKYVAVVPCADFGMPDYIRLSYATSMEIIKEGMDRIEAMVKELK